MLAHCLQNSSLLPATAGTHQLLHTIHNCSEARVCRPHTLAVPMHCPSALQRRPGCSLGHASSIRSRHSAARAPARRRGLRVAAMFTGIVQGIATVADVDAKENFKSFRIALPDGRAAGAQIGASVAINGTCLTVTAIDGDVLSFDVMAETLRATSLGGLEPGSFVNFERSARVGDEIGGHNVSGHVHCTARIVAVEDTENNRRVVFQLSDPAWVKYVLPKGFIAVDGCSLTVGEVERDTFSVYLIPETLRVTVFLFKGVGDAVNIEIEAQTQAIVDTVERVVGQYLGGAQGLGGGGGGGPQQQQQLGTQQQQLGTQLSAMQIQGS